MPDSMDQQKSTYIQIDFQKDLDMYPELQPFFYSSTLARNSNKQAEQSRI